jgi:glucose-1-phosphate cytidylyltransferase
MQGINKNVPVVILCGGTGTRLKEETEYKPKPMVTVGGRPILWHIMKLYAHHGFNNFILCLGYKGQAIKDYFLNYKWLASDFSMRIGRNKTEYAIYGDREDDIHIIFADTGEDTLTGERLKMVERYIPQQEFMLTYGDGVANLNINALVNFHRRQGTAGTLTGVHPTSKYGMVSVGDNNLVASFAQKPKLNEYVNGGFMVFRRDFFSYLRGGQMIEEALVDLAGEKQLSLYRHDDFWHCMDTYKDYEDLNKMWKNNPQWKIWSD